MVHLRDMPPIARLTAHPLHEVFPLWNTRGRAVTVPAGFAAISGISCTDLGAFFESYNEESTIPTS